jgi:hypothetical protein
MNVTWLALGAITLGLISLGLIAGGLLSTFAAGMATAPEPGDGKAGCIAAMAGIVGLGLAIWGFVA